jgi:hypothetical protein
MNRHFRNPVVFALAGLMALAAPSLAQDTAADRLLAKSLERTPRGSRDDLLIPLRRLRDPALRSFWGGLSTSARSDLRRHGVLGLAELESPPHLSAILLAKVADPAEQALILGEALAGRLVRDADVPDLLRLTNLDPLVEAVLRGRLKSTAPENLARLEEIAASGGPAQRVVAAMILGKNAKSDPLPAAVEAFMAQSEPLRGAKAGSVLSIIAREKLSGGAPFFVALREAYKSEVGLEVDILRVWLDADPASARPELARLAASANDPASKLRASMLMLNVAAVLTPADIDELDAPSDAAWTPIVRAARAIASKKGEVEALVALAAHGELIQPQFWAIERSREWPKERALAVCRAIVESVKSRASTRAPVAEPVALAAERLADEGDWAWLGEKVQAAASAGDAPLTLALLVGVVRSSAVPQWTLSASAWPDSQTSALALVIEARQSASFTSDPARIERLRNIAQGVEGRLTEPLRVQAAWLAAKVSGVADPTIARLLAQAK